MTRPGMDLAHALEVLLPGTKAAFRAGVLNRSKAGIIAWATQLLDPAEARKAEALVLGRAGSLTPGGLRAAIGRAVMADRPGEIPGIGPIDPNPEAKYIGSLPDRGHQLTPASSASTYRTVAPAGSVTGVHHVR
jgi:hypothetical protein